MLRRPLRVAPLVLLLGCVEEPSMQLSWRISEDPAQLGDYEAAPELASAVQCSAVGISKVRLTVRPAGSDGEGKDYEFPCYPGELVDGPALAPGEYELELRGLRRAGTPWTEALFAGGEWQPSCGEQDPCPAFATGSVEIREGALPEVEFVLLAPPQCDDGIDNDLDGQVDQHDLACRIEGLISEGDDVGLTIFELSVGFLSNPSAEPANLGITQLEFRIEGWPEGEDWSPWPSGAIASLSTSSFPFTLPLVVESLPSGTYELSVTALAGDEELTAAVAGTVPGEDTPTATFTVDASEGGYVRREFKLGADAFLQPITDGFSLVWNPVDESGALVPVCSAAITELRVRVTDGQGTPLTLAELGLPGSEGMDGWITSPCSASFMSAPLVWDDLGYLLDFEARNGEGTTCFALSDYALVPRGSAGSELMLVPPAADELPDDCL